MDREERVTQRNITAYSQDQLQPCSRCDLNKDDCGKRIVVSTPGKASDVLCTRYGAIEIIDLSLEDASRKHRVLSLGQDNVDALGDKVEEQRSIRIVRNGKSQNDNELLTAGEAAL